MKVPDISYQISKYIIMRISSYELKSYTSMHIRECYRNIKQIKIIYLF